MKETGLFFMGASRFKQVQSVVIGVNQDGGGVILNEDRFGDVISQ